MDIARTASGTRWQRWRRWAAARGWLPEAALAAAVALVLLWSAAPQSGVRFRDAPVTTGGGEASGRDAPAGGWRVVGADRPRASFVPPLDMSPETLPPHAFVTAPSVALSRGTGAPLACSGRAEGEPARALPFTLVHARTAAGEWAQRARVDGVVGAALAAAGASPFAMVGLSPGRDAVVASVAEAADGSEWSQPQTLALADEGRVFVAPLGLSLSRHGGRVWVAVTDEAEKKKEPADRHERVRVFFAETEADLSSPASWSQVPGAANIPDTGQAASMPGGVPGVLESFSWGASASVVPAPGAGASGVSVVASAAAGPRGDAGVLLRQSASGKLAYDKMVTLPGAHAPFAVRFHEPSGYYVALTNAQPRHGVELPPACFNRLDNSGKLWRHLAAAEKAAAAYETAVRHDRHRKQLNQARRAAGYNAAATWGSPHDVQSNWAAPAAKKVKQLPCCDPIAVMRECTGRCVWCREKSRSSLWLVVSRDLAQWRAVVEVAIDVSHRAESWASDALFGVQHADFSFTGPGGGSLLAVAAVAEDNAYAGDRPVAVRAYGAEWLADTLATAPPDELRAHKLYSGVHQLRPGGQGASFPASSFGVVNTELVAAAAPPAGADDEYEVAVEVGAGENMFPGSPCVVRLSNPRTLLLTHDLYGSAKFKHELAAHVETYVRRRDERSGSWDLVTIVKGMYYATVFETAAQPGVLWMAGTNGKGSLANTNNPVVVSVSRDRGSTWSEPAAVWSPGSDRAYTQGAATSVAETGGRVWRVVEMYEKSCTLWGVCAQLVVLSAPAEADLTRRGAWSASPPRKWPSDVRLPDLGTRGAYNATGWLEANMISVRGGGVAAMSRIHSSPRRGLAAVVHLAPPGPGQQSRPLGDVSVVRFPGGHSKFAVRLHGPSGYYVALSSANDESAAVDHFPACYNTRATQEEVGRTFAQGEGGEAPLTCCRNGWWRECRERCMWCRDQARARLWILVSRDLLHWRPVQELMSDRSSLRGTWMSDFYTGFQYPDFAFDGDKGEALVAAVRTAFGDTDRMHDSNEIRVVRSNWLEAALRSAPAGEPSDGCALDASGGGVVCRADFI